MLIFEDMKHFLATIVFFLATLLPLAAQNNPYEIDDECYKYFREAELEVANVASDAFEKANAKLLETAVRKKDEKARTLYYVGALKRASRVGRAAPLEDLSALVGAELAVRIHDYLSEMAGPGRP